MFIVGTLEHQDHTNKLFIVAPGAVIESSTTTVTRKQEDYVISGDQVTHSSVGAAFKAPTFVESLPANTEVEAGSTVT